MKKGIAIVSFCFLVANMAFAETIFTHRGKESETDTRRDYDIAILKMALEKTVDKYGPYKLVSSGKMNTARSLIAAEEGKKENFFVKQSVSKKLMAKMGYVPIPVDRGIVGYRVFFVSPAVADRLKKVETIDQLKEFVIGQGIGWLDTDILKHNGFKVKTSGNYSGLFEMVALGRIDLFARGTNELLREFEAHKNIEGLMYDDSVALYYPLPRFFFTSKSNKKAMKRIEEGLIAGYKDGSFQKVWEKYYGPSVEFVDLKNRKIFKIDNQFLKGIDTSYEKYIYHPK